MKKIFLISLILGLSITNLLADDYFWVGNGGNWTDYSSHWATSSGGSTMHISFPDIDDNVYFDALSFSEDSQVIAIDINHIECLLMSFSGVPQYTEIIGATTDTLRIGSELHLESANILAFNVKGVILFQPESAGQTLTCDLDDQEINANVIINIPSGALNVLSDLLMPQKNLHLINGTLDMSSNNMGVGHFNAQDNVLNPIVVTNAAIKNIDTLVCRGSLHFVDQLDILQFNGLIQFNSQAEDTNYINFDNHILSSKIIFNSSKKYFAISDIITDKDISLNFSGEFDSQNNNITCKTFDSSSPLMRVINLGTSNLELEEFIIGTMGLTLNSASASLIFNGLNEMYFHSNKTDIQFDAINLNSTENLIWNGKISCVDLSLIEGSKLFMEGGTELAFTNLTAIGNCGEFIEIRALCDATLAVDGVCVNVKPILNSGVANTAQYLKVSNTECVGTVTATNSYDEGGNINWSITEPSSVSTLYWIGNTGNWNDKGNWSSSTGGLADACVPAKGTHVVFDNNSFVIGDTVKLFDYGYCASMTWLNIPANVVLDGDGKLFMTDSLVFHSNLLANFSGEIHFESTDPLDTIPLASNSVEINAYMHFDGDALWEFVDFVVVNNTLELERGRIQFTGGNAKIDNILSSETNTRSLILLNTDVEISGEGVVWDINSTNITLNAIGSELSITNTSPVIKEFKGDGLIYNDIICVADYVKMWGSNTINRLAIMAGNTLVLEQGINLQVDSLDAIGACDFPISLISTEFDNPAVLKKSSHDTLTISNFYLKNIKADTVGGKLFEANETFRSGNVEGWTFNDTLQGKTFVWQGNNSNWHDLSNWKVNTLPAVCLPTIRDTVIVDPVIFNTAMSNDITIDRNAYCQSFIASGLTKYLTIELSQNLNISEAFVLCDSVGVKYSVVPDLSDLDLYDYGLVLMPDSTMFTLSPFDANIDVNIYANASYLTDTIILTTNLKMDTIASLSVVSGCLLAQNKTIQCGFLYTSTGAAKILNIEKSNVIVLKDLEFQNTSLLTFVSDSSIITIPGNQTGYSFFSGNGQTFYDVDFLGNIVDDENDNLVFISGSNEYNILSIFDGITVFAESSKIQTVDSALVVMGTCANYVSLCSSEVGTQATFTINSTVVDTVICVNIKDVKINTAVAMLSNDNGNNIGWTFNSTLAADADFSLPYPACITENLVFSNQSVSMWGGTTNLIFEWMVENDDTTNVVDMNYTFNLQGDYDISLMATDTITGCSEVFENTLIIEQQTSFITSSVPGLEICEGYSVTFNALSDLGTEFKYYLNNTYVDLGNPAETQYTTDTLKDADIIRVDAIYNGCVKSSNDLIFTVNNSPVALMYCSDADTTICAGDTVSFTATADSVINFQYEFFVNGISQGGFTSDSVYTSHLLADNDTVTARALSAEGCFAWLPNEYIVSVDAIPVVIMTSIPNLPTMCDGEEIDFSSSGALLYSFYINGVSVTDTTIQDSYQTSALSNNDIAICLGIDVNGCTAYSNTIEVTVNQSPNPDFVSDDLDQNICTGDELIFSAHGAEEYLYYIDGIPQGAFSNTSDLITSTLTHGQIITLEGRIDMCSEMSTTVMTFNVYPVIELSASTTTICPGENIDFTAIGDTVYQFLVDGIAVTPLGANNTFSSATITDGQQVSVIGTPGGCFPNPMTIIVNPLPTANVTCSESDTAICIGDNLSFIASGAEQYEFFIDGASQGPASVVPNFSTAAFTDGQQITVLATSEYSCVASALDTFNVVVYDYPIVSLSSSVAALQMCEGDLVSFTAAGADEYQFFVAGNQTGAFSPIDLYEISDLGNAQVVSVHGQSNACVSIATQTYSYTVYSLPNVSLTAITPISVCQDDEISIQANGAIDYEFFLNSASQNVPIAIDVYSSTVLSDGDYITATGYQNSCPNPSSDTIYVNVNQVPNVVFTSSVPAEGICYGDIAEFYVSGAMTFQFYLDGVEHGVITSETTLSIPWLVDNQTIEVIGYNNACFAPAINSISPIIHFVNAQLTVDPEQAVICDGESVTLSATGGDLFEFFLNDMSQGASSATSTNTISNISDADYISVEVTDLASNCKSKTGDYTINVISAPQITVDPDTDFCENDSVILSSDFQSDNQWYYNSAEIIGAVEEIFVAHQGGAYSVYYTSGEDGGVNSCGVNSLGQLGTGGNVQSLLSVETLIDEEIVSVSAGEEFSVALSNQNTVYAWGDNTWGNLGNGTFSPVYDPILLQSIDNIIQVTAGSNHVIALKSDNTLLAWGKNTNGQLGYGTYASSNFPMAVVSISDVQSISAGRNHSLALTTSGEVYAWGANNYGQLGNGDFVEQNQPVLVSGINNVVWVSCGADFSMAVRDDGTVWTWGCNDNGQLGHNDIISRNLPEQIYNLHKISMLTAGNKHALALNERGEVFAWGGNTEGQLGIGTTNQSLIFERLDITGVKSIEAGSYNSYAIKNDGSVWSWGFNNFGQLGDQTTVNKSLPIRADQFFGIVDLGAGNDFVCLVRKESKSCSSDLVSLNMDTVPDVLISKTGMILSTIEGVSYQWYFNSSQLSNSNSQTINITAQGVYTVEVFFENGCSAMSEEFSFYLNVEDYFVDQNVIVFPNPSKGYFELSLNMPESVLEKIQSWTLYSLTGKIIETNDSFSASDTQNLKFEGLAPGTYYLRIQSSIGVMNVKVFITQ